MNMLQKAFYEGVYQKALVSDPNMNRDDFFMQLLAN